jgi:N-acetylglutamate synthase-like GNAT family acetyltransferase
MRIVVEWRAAFESAEVDVLHREAFDTGESAVEERDWRVLVEKHSLGWVTAREGGRLVGFANVIWDGSDHAWLQDVTVTSTSRHEGIGTRLVTTARDASKEAGCEWLHVDFDGGLASFYFNACGFAPTTAGLLHLT